MQHSMLQVCRGCGESLAWAFSVHYECPEPKNAKNLMTVFGIDLLKDDSLFGQRTSATNAPTSFTTALRRQKKAGNTLPGW